MMQKEIGRVPKNLQRLHGLEAFLQNAGNVTPASIGVHAAVLRNLSYLIFRGSSNDANLMERVRETLGQSLPDKPNTTSVDEHKIYWLGPDEWMICSASDDADSLGDRLRVATSKLHVAINDVSGGMVTIKLTGDGVRRLLSKGCTLDFHPDEFKAGDCAQSGLAKANVIVGHSKDGLAFDIIVRRSFADYLALWLQRAGKDSGIEFH
tara:strand:+ start:60 stop:683 length:624 start_codon:yes stop_codon:yes gene_type:complete